MPHYFLRILFKSVEISYFIMKRVGFQFFPDTLHNVPRTEQDC